MSKKDANSLLVDFFYGFHFVDLGENQRAFIATPEKALLDLIYLEPGADTHAYLSELRLNNLEQLDWQRLEHFVRKFEKPKLIRAMAAIRDLAGEEAEFESLYRTTTLLYEFGLSTQRDEFLAVKIEVVTNPPAGAGLETTLIRRHVTLRLQHHDRSSLLAGKLHAIFQGAT